MKSFRMGDATVTVLKQLDLDVRDGEFVAIEGRSGTGKSTLLHILAGLDDCDAGTIDVNGVQIGKLAGAAAQRRKWIRSRFLFSIPMLSPILDAFLVLFTSGADRQLSKVRNEQFGFVFQFYYLLPELNVMEKRDAGSDD